MPKDLSRSGRFVSVTTSALRPRAALELREYGIARRLRGARVIDIGTGDGRLAVGAAVAGARLVVGVDPDPSALAAGRERARAAGAADVAFRLGSAQELPAASETFDVAILSWTL